MLRDACRRAAAFACVVPPHPPRSGSSSVGGEAKEDGSVSSGAQAAFSLLVALSTPRQWAWVDVRVNQAVPTALRAGLICH